MATLDNVPKMTEEQKALFDGLAPMCQKACINSLSGMSNIDSYEAAGGKGKTKAIREASASRMLSNVKAKLFLDSMNQSAVSDAVMSKQEMLERLSNLSRVNMSDLIEFATVTRIGEEGEPIQQSTWQFKDSALQDELAMASISEVATTKEGFKIKQHSQLSAMNQLAELAGYKAAQKVESKTTVVDDSELDW